MSKLFTRLSLAAAAALFVSLSSAPAHAASSSALFILDGSGSMWERVEGQPKIVIAKRVLKDALARLPADTAVGLMTYGTHRKGDCRDITLMSPIGSESPAAIASKVAAIVPKGDTPIAAALLKAGTALKSAPGRRMIVLVTDGAEECHGNPCDSVKQLEASGLEVQINVVGFNLGDKQRAAVACIASEGHGQYFDAKNTAGLTDAMNQVQAEVAQAAPPPPPPPPPSPSLLSPANGGQVIAAPDASWQGAISGNDKDMVSTPCGGGWPVEAVFAFRDEKPATFSRFEILIPGSGNWIKDFELLASSDSPTGTYRSLGKFTTQNALMLKSPYQGFDFTPATARYFKLSLISTHGGGCPGPLTQIRLIGKLGDGPGVTPAPPPTTPNILAASQGGQVIAAPDASWTGAISGNDKDMVATPCGGGWPVQAIFAFKDEKPATFSRFDILIPSTGNWIKDFELLAASDSPTGTYRSLGKFTTLDALIIKSPYQSFTFPQTTAKYLKLSLISTHGGGCPGPLTQIRLYGGAATGAATAAAPHSAPPPPSHPSAPPSHASAPPPSKGGLVNVLAASAGGELISAPGAEWKGAISGNDKDMVSTPCGGGWPVEAVFGFKGGRAATFSRFEILIPSTGNWIKDFELMASDQANGKYRSLGKFTTQDALVMRSPYQGFNFKPATAKFFKLVLKSTHGGGCPGPLTQIRLMGKV